ncbi:protein S100-A10-like [Echinops telfairi]|uniref:Protein S100-A10-like n=1 Tax=Echinops telfairi TaxID=9371 RepID=A0AC55CS04_ECHTE|nr:protein S100-A10-like [Echinops telfairi]
MPCQMEYNMETMMFTFHKFAVDKCSLTKEDLGVLMEEAFSGFLESQNHPLAVGKIVKDLDQHQDGRVGFQSSSVLLTRLTIACKDQFITHMEQKGKKEGGRMEESLIPCQTAAGICPIASPLFEDCVNRLEPFRRMCTSKSQVPSDK